MLERFFFLFSSWSWVSSSRREADQEELITFLKNYLDQPLHASRISFRKTRRNPAEPADRLDYTGEGTAMSRQAVGDSFISKGHKFVFTFVVPADQFEWPAARSR